MWDFLHPVKLPHMIQRIDMWRHASMGPKNLILDNRSQRQVIKQIRKHLPSRRIFVFSDTLIVEPIVLGDCARFVVAPQDSDALFVADFERE